MAFLKQDKIYREVDGDLIINGYPSCSEKKTKYYFKSLNKKELEDYHILHIENFSRSIFKAIDMLKLNVDFWKQFKYECPFTGFEHLSLIPSHICVTDLNCLKDIIKPYQWDMFNDKEWMHNIFKDSFDGDKLSPSKLQTIMMGAHYTEASYPNDGYSSVIDVVLENGDGMLVICKLILWYNR